MKITFHPFTVHKRFALTISRGTTVKNTNLWLKIQQDNYEGWGEISPFSITTEKENNLDSITTQLSNIIPQLEQFHPLERQKIETFLNQNNIPSYIKAGIDVALWDWFGKKTGLPIYQLLGLNLNTIQPISVTIGISSPEKAVERLNNWLEVIDAKIIKIKLGNPAGIEADKTMFKAIQKAVPHKQLTVDANGGWTLEDGVIMCQFLANYSVKYVEQPLAVGEEDKLKRLSKQSPLPIFVDESCFNCQDIPFLADKVQGINIKLMKAGGLSEVVRMINVAKACNLQVMFGCYSDSSLSNAAMLHLAPLADYLDLDSHLNLIDDPFSGLILDDQGRLLPNQAAGLGLNREYL
jgi:L-alanine-DL-glutamate epimerase-like enolase superfamily enzyme